MSKPSLDDRRRILVIAHHLFGIANEVVGTSPGRYRDTAREILLSVHRRLVAESEQFKSEQHAAKAAAYASVAVSSGAAAAARTPLRAVK